MFCSKCGQKADDDEKFCRACGNNLSLNEGVTANINTNQQITQQPMQVVTVMPTGTAPLVMGLLGLFGGWIPVIQYITGILSLCAIFSGASQSSKLRKAGLPAGKATAGMILGIIAVIITITFIALSGSALYSLIRYFI